MARKSRPGKTKGAATPPQGLDLQPVMAALQRGDLAAAEQRLLLLRSVAPNDPNLENLFGGLRFKQGAVEEALACFQRAAKAAPQNPFFVLNKGKAELQLRLYEKAANSLGRAIKINPDFADAHALLGEALARLDQPEKARQSYAKALELNGALALARQGLGLLHLSRGEGEAAAEQFRALLEATPEGAVQARATSYANLGLAYERCGRKAEALPCLLKANQLTPGDAAFERALARNLRFAREFPEGVEAEACLLRLLASREVNPRSLSTAIQAVLRRKHRLDDFLAAQDRDPEAAAPLALDERLEALLADPLFLGLLSACPITDVELEIFVTRLRRDLLAAVAEGGEHPALSIQVLSALAEQSFLNEYVFYISVRERKDLERLVSETALGEGGGEPDWLRILTANCYRPLTELPFDLASCENLPEQLTELHRRQVLDAERERALMAALPALGESADAVSQSVERQYSENPYPRWTRCDLADPAPMQAAVRGELPHLAPHEVRKIAKPRILIAGCGTGLQTMRVVSTYAGASVLAVDISRPSIAYGMRKLEEYGVANVEHLRANILDLGALTERFDLIESYGVIHHMEDPAAALQVLSGLLKPKGLIFLGLYSEIGRQSVVRAREIAAEKGFAGDIDSIRAARRELMAMEDEAVAPLLSPASDFWTASDTRDLILHEKEHRLTLPEIGAMLAACGLEFLGLAMPPVDRNLFLSEAPEKGAARSVEALHAFEQRHPEIFGDTYKIWARKA